MDVKYSTNFDNFDPFYIGSKKLMDQLSSILTLPVNNYPPYNIRKKDEENYIIEIALAGFDKKDLEILLDDNKLTIKGNISSEITVPGHDFIFKGVATRPFTRIFAIADSVEVRDVELVNGMLSVYLENMTKQKPKSKRIEIA